MGNYKKNSPRLSIKFINGKTNELISSIDDRSWMDVAEFFSDTYVTAIMQQQFKGKVKPEHMIVLVAANYYLTEE